MPRKLDDSRPTGKSDIGPVHKLRPVPHKLTDSYGCGYSSLSGCRHKRLTPDAQLCLLR